MQKKIKIFYKNKSQISNAIVFLSTLVLLTIIRILSGIRLNSFDFDFYDWLYMDILLSTITVMFGNLISSLVSKYLKKPNSCNYANCVISTSGAANKQRKQISRKISNILLNTIITIQFCGILICNCIALALYIAGCCLLVRNASIAIAVMCIINAAIANINYTRIMRSLRCCGF